MRESEDFFSGGDLSKDDDISMKGVDEDANGAGQLVKYASSARPALNEARIELKMKWERLVSRHIYFGRKVMPNWINDYYLQRMVLHNRET